MKIRIFLGSIVVLILGGSILAYYHVSYLEAITETSAETVKIKTDSKKIKAEKDLINQAENPTTSAQTPAKATTLKTGATLLDQTSNLALANTIAETMTADTQLGAKWTVAMRAVDDAKKRATVTNWTPENHQVAASSIKLFVLLTVYNQFKAGKLSATTSYSLKAADIVGGTGTLQSTPVGTRYTLGELAQYMMEQSDNTATNILINQVGGFAAVNDTIATLVGRDHQSMLKRYMMDFDKITTGQENVLDATEACDALVKLASGALYDVPTTANILALMSHTTNQSKLPRLLPAGALFYNKSGESVYRGVENDMAIIEYHGEKFVIVALSAYQSEAEGMSTFSEDQNASEAAVIASLGLNVTNWMTSENK